METGNCVEEQGENPGLWIIKFAAEANGDKYKGLAVVKAYSPSQAERIFMHDGSFNGHKESTRVQEITRVPVSIEPMLLAEFY